MRALLLTVFMPFAIWGQSFFTPSDTLSPKRTAWTSLSIGGVWTGSTIGLASMWYSNSPQTKFHFFDDGKEWLQMDKAGHFYTANKISQLSYDLYKWSGWKNNSAAWMGFGIANGFQLTIELLDGFSRDWGFSPWDIAANVGGSTLFLVQQLTWKEQRIFTKFSYHPTQYAALRPNVLGSTGMERLLKDYNGQTYWLSINPSTFGKNNPLPKWLCVSFGYSINGKLHGELDSYQPLGSAFTYQAEREFLLSLDVDFSRIKTKKPWLNAVLRQFNYIKIPFPALRWKGDVFYGHWLYF